MNAASDDLTGSAIRPIAIGMDGDPVPDPPTLSSSVPGMSAPLSAYTHTPGQGQFPMGEPIAMTPAMTGGVQPLVTADYRSRTWCLSSGFRLGLRAKVAVI